MKVKSDLTGKPYFKCADCPQRKDRRCNFTRTSELPLYDWCVYIRDFKIINGLTNDYIAKESGVSIKTIERIVALNCDQDIMRETARRIEIAVCGAATHFPCYLIAEEEKLAIEQKLQDALKALERANEINADLRKQVEYLRTENELKANVIGKLLDK